MLPRRIDPIRHDLITIFDYKMLSVMVFIGGISALSLGYMLNRSCIAYRATSQTAFVNDATSRPLSSEEIIANTRQQPQDFVFKYPDGSLKRVNIPSNANESKIRTGIMLRHNKARQGI